MTYNEKKETVLHYRSVLAHSGTNPNLKGCFYARVDQQLEYIDLSKTYLPVFQWTTFRSLLMLEIMLYLKSNQGDIKNASL